MATPLFLHIIWNKITFYQKYYIFKTVPVKSNTVRNTVFLFSVNKHILMLHLILIKYICNIVICNILSFYFFIYVIQKTSWVIVSPISGKSWYTWQISCLHNIVFKWYQHHMKIVHTLLNLLQLWHKTVINDSAIKWTTNVLKVWTFMLWQKYNCFKL